MDISHAGLLSSTSLLPQPGMRSASTLTSNKWDSLAVHFDPLAQAREEARQRLHQQHPTDLLLCCAVHACGSGPGGGSPAIFSTTSAHISSKWDSGCAVQASGSGPGRGSPAPALPAGTRHRAAHANRPWTRPSSSHGVGAAERVQGAPHHADLHCWDWRPAPGAAL